MIRLVISVTFFKALFDDFDASLGTLNEVHIDFTSTETTSGTFALTTGEQPQASASLQLSDSEQLEFAIPGILSVTSNYSSSPVTIGVTFPSDDSLTLSTSHPTSFGLGLSGDTYTSFFIGTDTFGIDFLLMQNVILTLLQGASASFQFNATWDPPVTVSYLYTPAPAQVSEPGSLALLLIGLAAALSFGRRRVTRNSGHSILRKTP